MKCDAGGGCGSCKIEQGIANQDLYAARGPFIAYEGDGTLGGQLVGVYYFVDSAFTTNTAVVTVTALSSGGSISNPAQSINVNTSPAQIVAGAAVGGNATYQWMQSTNGTSYADISGAIGQNYQPGNLSVTTYFKRKSSCGGTVLYTTNTATVTVLLPQFNAGCITSGNEVLHLAQLQQLYWRLYQLQDHAVLVIPINGCVPQTIFISLILLGQLHKI